ncbi:GIY-YIG nuclease family protein [Bacillus sp. ISL-35]|uniref:GIY-YIG nuclease family protein n=1 Tax=Bacillus sp. ISL-35 TaxID=2819122 RepID=UPI001BE74E4D|nr:GIY-YIG nuclease family protein [Bacillus sp. ISL-35]MBT2680484.1 GIY-YIG nuclease family protein [Bacillus sp. ISL-35]MBT2704223.1 GIY-YIG nuclease family protein [Chryseobacterium sp. ISL-80]
MDRKKELKQQYKETSVEAGVYQIKNTINNKILVGSTKNFKTLNGIKFMLETNGYTTNKELQKEWNQYGKAAFMIDILEKMEKKDDPYFNEKEALLALEEKWLEKLQPFGERGYN